MIEQLACSEPLQSLAPEEPKIWSLLARAYLAAGHIQEAAACAEKAVIIDPDSVVPLLLRGEIALMEGNPNGAQSRAQAALRIEPRKSECHSC